MAKNAGKTVTLNTIVKEAVTRNINLALISYGRDGEKVDAITLQEKPRIYIPPNTVFVTAHNAYKKSDVQANVIARTGIDSLMGEVNIYKSFTKGGYIELVGINSSSRVKKIKEMMPADIDLTLIDGALDRRSSAMPALTDAFIIATGAVVGNTEELVIKKTFHEIRRLSLPEVKNSSLEKKANEFLANSQDGIVYKDGSSEALESETSFGHLKELKDKDHKKIESLIINGALIDRFAEKLIYDLNLKEINLIVRDGTRVFLNKRNLNLMEKAQIKLEVLNSINLLAVTVNPTSPYSQSLNSEKIISGLKTKLTEIPVYDIMSEKYKTIER
ncbi:MAG: hypothetical protein ACQEQD_01555 [Bacillota bacterium]